MDSFILIMGIPFLVMLLLMPFWIWMLIEALTKEPEDGDTKLVWVLVILLAGPLGAVIYFFARRPTRIAEARESELSES